MAVRNFNQEEFLNSEEDSFGLDFLTKPNSIILAKDATSFVENSNILLNQNLVNNLINSWDLDFQNLVSIQNFPKSQTIDNALAALYFFINGEDAKAKNIYQFYLTNIPAIFSTGQDQIFDWINLETNSKGATEALSTAYLLYSLAYYQAQTNNTQFRQLAIFCAQQLIDLKSSTSNLIRDNYLTSKSSMEANVIAYLGLKLLIPFINTSDIINFTTDLKNSIYNDLGLKDNTHSTSFTSNSIIFAGIFANSTGNKFLLDSSKEFIKQHYISFQSSIYGIKKLNEFSLKETLLAAIFYFRVGQPSISYTFNNTLIEYFIAKGGFTSDLNISAFQSLIFFLILNKMLAKDFITEELFR